MCPYHGFFTPPVTCLSHLLATGCCPAPGSPAASHPWQLSQSWGDCPSLTSTLFCKDTGRSFPGEEDREEKPSQTVPMASWSHQITLGQLEKTQSDTETLRWACGEGSGVRTGQRDGMKAQAPHPRSGSTTMAWGSSIIPEISVLRFSPFICATSMTSRPESVQ